MGQSMRHFPKRMRSLSKRRKEQNSSSSPMSPYNVRNCFKQKVFLKPIMKLMHLKPLTLKKLTAIPKLHEEPTLAKPMKMQIRLKNPLWFKYVKPKTRKIPKIKRKRKNWNLKYPYCPEKCKLKKLWTDQENIRCNICWDYLPVKANIYVCDSCEWLCCSFCYKPCSDIFLR